MDIVIKKKKPGVDDYLELRKVVGWKIARDKTKIKTAIKNSLYFLTAYDGKRIVGMARIVGDGGYAFYIQDVIVLPEYQGRGIGKKLMDKIMGYFDKRGIKDAMIGLMASKGKEGFYEKYGFIRRPDKKAGAGMVFNKEEQ